MTDNRNRTAPEIRTIFGKYNGNLGSTGCVAYLFDRKGYFVLAPGSDEELVTEIALEHGGEDVITNDDGKLEVTCPPECFAALSVAFTHAKLECELSEVTQIAQTEIEVDAGTARSALKLLEMLDELLEEGRSILVFSQFTSMLALIEAELQKKQIVYALLTGDTVERGAEVKRF